MNLLILNLDKTFFRTPIYEVTGGVNLCFIGVMIVESLRSLAVKNRKLQAIVIVTCERVAREKLNLRRFTLLATRLSVTTPTSCSKLCTFESY